MLGKDTTPDNIPFACLSYSELARGIIWHFWFNLGNPKKSYDVLMYQNEWKRRFNEELTIGIAYELTKMFCGKQN